MIRSEQAHLPFSADSHPGMSGKNNEDSYGVFAYQIHAKSPIPVFVGIVSDGIGGHRAGEVASNIAVNVIKEHIDKSDGTRIPHDLEKAIVDASNRIQAQATSNTEQKGMGATVACVCVVGNRLFTATVGDSPIFLMRGNQIQQLSIDHTWIQEALDSGLLKPEQVEGHPNAHVIRRYLGGVKPPEVDFRMRLTGREPDEQARANQGTPLMPGDRLLLCSDGLTDLVKPDEILAQVKEKSKEQAVSALIDLANSRGGHDNITILLVEIPELNGAVTAAVPKQTPIWQYVTIGCLGLLILGVISGFFLISYIKNRQASTPTPTLTVVASATLASTSTSAPVLTSTPTVDNLVATQTAGAESTQLALDQTQQVELSASQTSLAQTQQATSSQMVTSTNTTAAFAPDEITGTPSTTSGAPSLETNIPTIKPPESSKTAEMIASPTASSTIENTPFFKTWTPRPTRSPYPTWTQRPTWKPIFP